MFSIDRTDKSILGQWWWSVDRWLLFSLFTLMLAGIILVMAASPAVAERIHLPPFHFVVKHLIFLMMSVFIMLSLSLLKLRNIWRIGLVLLIGSMIMLITTLVFGADIKGSSRWIHLFGFSLQPSEFVKPALAVVGAWLIAKQCNENKFNGLLISTIIYLMVLCLLIKQPDFGMSFVTFSIWATQIFLAGIPFALVCLIIMIGIVAVVIAYMTLPHVHNRIERFLNPSSGDNYQIEKSLDSFNHGGLFGTGPGEGQVKMYLPDAHADFIFAVAGEEFGLILTLLLIALFGFIIVRSMLRAINNKDMFCILAVAGISVQFALQTLIHMGSSLQILPAKGMTLPFISYGGSSLLSMGISMGIVLAMTRKDQDKYVFSNKDTRSLPTVRAVYPFFNK